MQLKLILDILQEIAPLEFAESWDNVGLLVGDPRRDVQRIMTCLTVSDVTLQEAIDTKAELIVTHHPIPFKPLSRITAENNTGKYLLGAIEAGIAIYSPHTAWDNAVSGINQQLAEMIGLESIEPLRRFESAASDNSPVGIGRCGTYTTQGKFTIKNLVDRLRSRIPIEARATHPIDHGISKVGIVCGSGGSLLDLVAEQGCDALLTGEATYHQCLDAQARNIAMILIGHHASEAFAMKTMATLLRERLPECVILASQNEYSRF